MGQPPTQVAYDFGAATALLQVLRVGHDKVAGVASLRGGQRSSQLGSPTGQNWEGRARQEFERDFSPEQRQLGQLADTLLRVISAVENANATAQAAARQK